MLESLITSKTRIKLLLKIFLNINNQSYSKSLDKKLYRANTLHLLFKDLNSNIRKFVGVEELLEKMIDRLWNVNRMFLAGTVDQGSESDIIDILIIGSGINQNYLGVACQSGTSDRNENKVFGNSKKKEDRPISVSMRKTGNRPSIGNRAARNWLNEYSHESFGFQTHDEVYLRSGVLMNYKTKVLSKDGKHLFLKDLGVQIKVDL